MQSMRNSYLHLNNFYKPLATINVLYTYAKRLKKTKRKQVENRKESINGEVKALSQYEADAKKSFKVGTVKG
jgi:hypothetical protein